VKEQKGYLRKVSTYIEITIDENKYLMSYKLTECVHSSCSDIKYQDIDTNFNENFKVVLNLQYFENVLNLIKDNQIKLKTNGNNRNIILFKGDNGEAVIMPINQNYI
jgi:DNA polymerase III sliding clamp (beta) subunit (PCNA family)